MELNIIVKDIEDILGIKNIKIEFANKIPLESQTALACSDFFNKKIILKCSDKDIISPILIFSLCHEFRHFYQFKYNPTNFKLQMKTYKESKNLSFDEYNLQPLELDANGFAVSYMILRFGIQPSFKKLSEKVNKQIYQKADEILSNEFKVQKRR